MSRRASDAPRSGSRTTSSRPTRATWVASVAARVPRKSRITRARATPRAKSAARATAKAAGAAVAKAPAAAAAAAPRKSKLLPARDELRELRGEILAQDVRHGRID